MNNNNPITLEEYLKSNGITEDEIKAWSTVTVVGNKYGAPRLALRIIKLVEEYYSKVVPLKTNKSKKIYTMETIKIILAIIILLAVTNYLTYRIVSDIYLEKGIQSAKERQEFIKSQYVDSINGVECLNNANDGKTNTAIGDRAHTEGNFNRGSSIEDVPISPFSCPQGYIAGIEKTDAGENVALPYTPEEESPKLEYSIGIGKDAIVNGKENYNPFRDKCTCGSDKINTTIQDKPFCFICGRDIDKKMKLFIPILLLFLGSHSFAGDKRLDSLQLCLQHPLNDSTRASILKNEEQVIVCFGTDYVNLCIVYHQLQCEIRKHILKI